MFRRASFQLSELLVTHVLRCSAGLHGLMSPCRILRQLSEDLFLFDAALLYICRVYVLYIDRQKMSAQW